MKFYSTKDKALRFGFEDAVKSGMAPDGGLFMPESIRKLPPDFWRTFDKKSFRELAVDIASHFLTDSISSPDLRKIIDRAIVFDAPLIKVEENVYALELFHGPTLAFKDFGARFLASVVGHFAEKKKEQVTILVATSGDTGSAVAHGFYEIPGVRVIVLYPSGKVSELQEKQFTTLGNNISALEVDGTFDDCQRLVKEAFADNEIRSHLTLTSANSINIARLLPQMFYYFRALQQLPPEERAHCVVSVPSGNFGNLTAGLMALKMGLPVENFIASTNANDVVPHYLKSGVFIARQSITTISNAMDVGNPSNFFRMTDLFPWEKLNEVVSGISCTDTETREAIEDVYARSGYIMDPHGAVAYLGLKKAMRASPRCVGIFLETAHPGKFKDVVEETIREKLDLPPPLTALIGKKKIAERMSATFSDLKKYLLK